MKKISLLFLACVFAWAAKAQTAHPDYQDGKIWFRIKRDYRTSVDLNGGSKGSGSTDFKNLPLNSLPFIKQLDKSAGITKLAMPFIAAKGSPELQRTYSLQFTNYNEVEKLIKQIEASGAVEYAEKVPLLKHCLTVNDPSYSSQWGLTKINATGAWNYFSTGSTAVVAVVDDAIERTHPDLSPNLWVNTGEIASNGIDDDGNGYIDDINGYDVADNDNNPNPPSSAFDHGTHVAGIVGARSNNAVGVASIGFSVKLMCVKSTNSASSVTDGYEGVIYAVESGADVINMSWGGAGSSTTAASIITYANSQGIVLVAAAGNSNVNTVFYPAGYPEVIAVAATTNTDTKASFSNYGTWVDVSAPGNNIFSTTVGATYGNKSGTSMASPMVAGLAGLMRSLNPGLPASAIKNCILTNAVNINSLNPGYVGELGSGRIDANASMVCVSASLSLPPTADFMANITTVTAGGSTTFTDLSTYSPTSWNWTFTGGTPATFSGAVPPAITYATPGTYAVSLTATNANGSDVETKTGYITVVADGGCTAVNFPPPAAWSLITYNAGADGFVNGNNAYGDKEKAMFFNTSASPATHMQSVLIAFSRAYSSTPATDIVPVRIYDGTGGVVGTQIATVNLTMAQIMADVAAEQYTQIDFVATPVVLPVSKQFFVSVDVSNLSWASTPKDSLSLMSNLDPQTTPSVVWEKWNDNSWHRYTTSGSFNLNISLFMHPVLTSTPVNAAITTSATTICEDNSITFNANPGSTYQDTLVWVFPGGTPLVSSNPVQSVMFNNPGTYLAKLYVVGGGCGFLDSAEVTITVNPKPNLSVTASATPICVGDNAVLTASGASSYSWAPATFLSGTTGAMVTSTPTSTIQYTVTGTLGSCQNSAIVEIVVNPDPVADITIPVATICTGSSINFDGSGSDHASTFNWTLTGGSPASSTAIGGSTSYATAGTYSVSLQVTNSCGTDTETESITVVNGTPVSFTYPDAILCPGESAMTLTPSPAGGTFSGPGITGSSFDPSTAGIGTHTITYEYFDSGSGCTSSSTDDIDVVAAPTATITISDPVLCAGGSPLALTGTPTGGSFTGTGVTGSNFDPTTAGVGTFTITYSYTDATSGCSDTENGSIQVVNNPTVSFDFATDSICTYNSAVTLSGTPAGGSFTGTGVTGSSFDPATAGAGTYTITYTYTDVTSGCSNTDTDNIVVDNCLGVNDLNNENHFAIYPNPAAFNLTVQGSIDFNQVQLVDMTGRVVTNITSVINNQSVLMLNDLPNGVYTVRILNSNNLVYQEKLVISK